MIYLSLFLLGFVSLGYQVILLREIFSVFSDNELTIGIFLACWMLWAAAGSFVLGRFAEKVKNPRGNLGFAAALVGAIMPFEIFLIRILRPAFQSTPTEMLGILPLLAVSFFSTAAIGFIFGVWYVFASKMLAQKKEFGDVVSLSYSVETCGAVLGGIAASIIFSVYLGAVQSAIIYSIIIFLYLSLYVSKKYFAALALFAVCLFGSGYIEKYSVSRRWLPFEAAESKNSPYGNITVLKSDVDSDFYLNSSRVCSTYLLPSNEEIVHIPMSAAPAAKNVLVIGGGERDIGELLKYPSVKVVYVEPDKIFFKLLKKYGAPGPASPFNDKRVAVVSADGRYFVAENGRKAGEKFDCVILDVPPPVTGLANRYFTLECFREIKRSLSPAGVVIFPLFSSENYMSGELKILSASIYKTASSVFDNIAIIPGSNNYFICSGFKLDIQPAAVSRELKTKGIKTTYLTPYQLSYVLRPDRAARLAEWVTEKEETATLNRDMRPVCYFYGLRYWLSYFSRSPLKIQPGPSTVLKSFLAASVICFLVFLAVSKSKRFFMPFVMLLASGYSMVLELLVIFAFQSVYGCIYYKIGTLLAVGLLGLGCGSYWSGRYIKKSGAPEKTIRAVMASGGSFAILLPYLLKYFSSLPRLGEPLFYVLIFVSFSVSGVIFPLAIACYRKADISALGGFYSIDLIGAAAGSLAVSVYLIPVLGIPASSVLAGICMYIPAFFIKS